MANLTERLRRKRISLKLMLEVMGGNDFKCQYCGYDGAVNDRAFESLTVDHFSSDDESNLVTACGLQQFQRQGPISVYRSSDHVLRGIL